MNEWEFTAEVAGWINEILAKNPSLQLYRAKCEQRGKGSLKRRDLPKSAIERLTVKNLALTGKKTLFSWLLSPFF